jgi:hypothetical protein
MNKNETYEFLSEWFEYDTQSPSCLKWKKTRPYAKIKAGEHITSGTSYYQATIARQFYQCHRVILILHGMFPGQGQVSDHINGNPRDNRIENLRWVTVSQNNSNRKPLSSSGIKYARVTPSGKYRGYYRCLKQKKTIMCGTYDTAYAAHLAAITHKLQHCWMLNDD